MTQVEICRIVDEELKRYAHHSPELHDGRWLTVCGNCGMFDISHAQGRCLFSPTQFKQIATLRYHINREAILYWTPKS